MVFARFLFLAGGVLLLSAEAGSRPGGRGTLLCFAKEKYPKERRPYCVLPLRCATGQPRGGGGGGRRRPRPAPPRGRAPPRGPPPPAPLFWGGHAPCAPRPRAGGRRWPVGMSGCGFPSVRAEKRRAGGACVCRRTHALRALTRRSCLNGARSAQ